MPIDTETVELVGRLINTEGVRVVRGSGGDWTLIATVCDTVKVDDSRAVRFAGEIRIRGRQLGRKNGPPLNIEETIQEAAASLTHSE